MTRGELVAAEARSWVGTPFVWGQSQKGRGCDCKGLVEGVARELGFPEAGSFYARFRSYRDDKAVPSRFLLEGMAAIFDRVEARQPGDVLILHLTDAVGRKLPPQHMAIVLGERAVHAQGKGPRERVKEPRLEALLRLCPLHSIWRWRD